MSVGVYFTLRLIISLMLLIIGGMMVALGGKFFKQNSRAAGVGFVIFGALVISLAVRGVMLSF
ncbi:hypothetical protein [Paenibacillus dauci]|uniref:hypothetical protein n=1 Tax=Paenibacillus dauci TaxID=1567106 RepID=UPI00061990D9|nr:hypothetical protein [Paenibacillus dauci]